MEALNLTNIGKFCVSKKLIENGDFFYLISGIDCIESAYIVRKVKDFYNIYIAYTLEQMEKEFKIYSYFEAFNLVKKEENRYTAILERFNAFNAKIANKEFHQNELNELNKIFRAYSESIKQCALLKIYAEKWSHNLSYIHEYQKTKKSYTQNRKKIVLLFW